MLGFSSFHLLPISIKQQRGVPFHIPWFHSPVLAALFKSSTLLPFLSKTPSILVPVRALESTFDKG